MKHKKRTTPPVQKKISEAGGENRSRGYRLTTVHWALLTGLFSFFLYSQSISFDYALDDQAAITSNTLVQKGVSSIPELLQTDFWHGNNLGIKIPIYRPGSLVLFAMEWQFFPDSPGVYHFVNILLYALSCGLLFVILARIFHGQHLLFPLLCTLLFSAHPIHTEVVNNIKGADDLLCFVFQLLSIFCCLRYFDKRFFGWMAGTVLFYFCSLLCKESGIAFLLVTPMMVYFFTPAKIRETALVAGCLFVPSVLYFYIRYQVLKSIPEYDHSPLVNTIFAAPDFISQKATAVFVLFKYITQLVAPVSFSYTYDFAQVKVQDAGNPMVWLSALLYGAAGAWALLRFRHKSIPAFAILFYLLTLAPVANIFVTIGSIRADRFLFIPSLGFCILLVWIIFKVTHAVLEDSGESKNPTNFSTHARVIVASVLLLGFYSVTTLARSRDWKNNTTLFGNDVKVAPESASAHYHWGNNLAQVLYEKEGDPAAKNILLDKAIVEYHTALMLFPGYMDAYRQLGDACAKRGDDRNAIANFEKYSSLVNNSDIDVLKYLGGLCDKTGQYEKAIYWYSMQLKMQGGNDPAANYYIGLLYNKLLQYNEALPFLETAIQADRGYKLAYKNKALAYLNLGRNEDAINTCNDLLKLDSTYAKAWCYIGFAHINKRDYSGAIKYLQKSMDLDSTDKECRGRLEVLRQMTGTKN